jgi:hypothetical protein
MKTEHSVFWYPFRPSLRWPIRLLGIIGAIMVVVKLVMSWHWDDCFRFVGPLWLLTVSFDTPELKPKTAAYFVGALLAWLAIAFTLFLIGFLAFSR